MQLNSGDRTYNTCTAQSHGHQDRTTKRHGPPTGEQKAALAFQEEATASVEARTARQNAVESHNSPKQQASKRNSENTQESRVTREARGSVEPGARGRRPGLRTAVSCQRERQQPDAWCPIEDENASARKQSNRGKSVGEGPGSNHTERHAGRLLNHSHRKVLI